MTAEEITGSNGPTKATSTPLKVKAFSWDEWAEWVKATKFKTDSPFRTYGKPL